MVYPSQSQRRIYCMMHAAFTRKFQIPQRAIKTRKEHHVADYARAGGENSNEGPPPPWHLVTHLLLHTSPKPAKNSHVPWRQSPPLQARPSKCRPETRAHSWAQIPPHSKRTEAVIGQQKQRRRRNGRNIVMSLFRQQINKTRYNCTLND